MASLFSKRKIQFITTWAIISLIYGIVGTNVFAENVATSPKQSPTGPTAS